MYFNSFAFLIFLPSFLACYWILRGRARIAWCLAGSYLFYGWWDYRFLSLLLISTLVDYSVGRRLSVTDMQSRRRLLLGVSIACNLGILGTFKYYNFFAESFADAIGPFGMTLDWTTRHIVLPAGISFYTFQTLSYSIDIYRRQLDPERDLLRFATFVAFFPQLVAGPIVRAGNFLPQLQTDRVFEWQAFEQGFGRILLGLFKKIVIADSIGVVADPMFNSPEAFTSLNTLIIVVLYAFQVYGDFSGYCDIAIGSAKMMGFELPENFRYPYFATSPSDFWHRWHISLSTWLRDYVYIPLGGSRNGRSNTYRNLAITMLLGGLWHGASWHFVIWGGIHGLYLIVHRIVSRKDASLPTSNANDPPERGIPIRFGTWAVKVIMVFTAVCFAWIFFRSETLADALTILSRIASLDDFSPSNLDNRISLLRACGMVSVFVAFELAAQVINWRSVFDRVPPARAIYYASLLWAIALTGTFGGTRFIYFQF